MARDKFQLFLKEVNKFMKAKRVQYIKYKERSVEIGKLGITNKRDLLDMYDWEAIKKEIRVKVIELLNKYFPEEPFA